MPYVDAFPLPPSARVTVPRTGTRAFGAPRSGHSHAGVDLFAARGTSVLSPVDGTIVATLDDARRACGFGVVIRSTDGYLWTLCHLGAVPVVERGDHVEAGDVLGVVGTTGNASASGPHLHIQATTLDRVPVDSTDALADALVRERGGSTMQRRTSAVTTTADTRSDRERASGIGPLVLAGLALYAMTRR